MRVPQILQTDSLAHVTIISQFDHRGIHFLFSKSLTLHAIPSEQVYLQINVNRCQVTETQPGNGFAFTFNWGGSSFVKMPTFLRFTAKKGTLNESCTFKKLTSLIKPVPKELMSFNQKYALSMVLDFQSQSRDLCVQYAHNQCKQKFYV